MSQAPTKKLPKQSNKYHTKLIQLRKQKNRLRELYFQKKLEHMKAINQEYKSSNIGEWELDLINKIESDIISKEIELNKRARRESNTNSGFLVRRLVLHMKHYARMIEKLESSSPSESSRHKATTGFNVNVDNKLKIVNEEEEKGDDEEDKNLSALITPRYLSQKTKRVDNDQKNVIVYDDDDYEEFDDEDGIIIDNDVNLDELWIRIKKLRESYMEKHMEAYKIEHQKKIQRTTTCWAKSHSKN